MTPDGWTCLCGGSNGDERTSCQHCGRIKRSTPGAAPARRLTYPEAAAELRCEESWLRRHIKELPHTKLGRVVTFSDDDLARIYAMHHRDPQSPAPLRAVGGSHPLASLKPLPRRGAGA
jgi:hypothetical protein